MVKPYVPPVTGDPERVFEKPVTTEDEGLFCFQIFVMVVAVS